MSALTSHVLDTALGQPARNLALRLDVQGSDAGDPTWLAIATSVTDGDGRVGDVLGGQALATGTYRITFETGTYFRATGRPVFYPRVEVQFVVALPTEHHHIPLLLSPFGYSTYRGS
jgi:5-hydroxyisourate hydrolase